LHDFPSNFKTFCAYAIFKARDRKKFDQKCILQFLKKSNFYDIIQIITQIIAVDKFVTKRLTLLKQHNINAICVFDGQRLSSKKDTNEKRGKSRDEAKSKAIQALKVKDYI
jgi:hypothetical protein